MLVHPKGELLDKITHQQRDILVSLAKRWHADGKNIQAVEQITTELALGHALAQVAIGGSNQPDVDPYGSRAAQALEFLVLQDPQKFRLQFQRDVSHFVQEHGPAIRQLQPADLLTDRTGEGASFMAE